MSIGSNVPSKQLSCYYIHGFNESRSFIYTQLYTITSRYYFNTYYNGQDEDRTHVPQAFFCS